MKIVKLYVAVSGFTPDRQLGILKNKELFKLSAKLRNVWKAGVFPSEEIKPTGTLRKAVYDTLFKYGVLGGDGGWTVPEENAMTALNEVKAIQVRHEAYSKDLVSRWPVVCAKAVADFEKQFHMLPESAVMADDLNMSVDALTEKLSEMMQHRQPSVQAVASKLRFAYSVKVYENMVEGEDALSQAIRESLKNEGEDLFTQMIKDTVKVADEMFSLLTTAGDASKAVNRRTLRKGEDMLVNRVKSLAFIDKRLYSLAAGVEEVLAPLTSADVSKTLRVGECGDLIALLAVLSNEERLKGRLESLKPGEPLLPASAKQEIMLVVDNEDMEQEEVPVEAATDSDSSGADSALVDEDEEVVFNWG